MKTPRPVFVMIIVTCVWGSTFVVTQSLLRSVPPFSFMALRFGIAALFMLAYALLRTGWQRTDWRAKQLYADGAILGALNAVGMIFQVFGQVYTTASKSAFITSLNTPLTPIIGLLVYRSIPDHAQRVAVVIASAGLALLTWPPAGEHLNTGDLLTVGCATSFAFYIVLSARRAPRQDAFALSAVQICVSALAFGLAWAAARLALAHLPVDARPAFLLLELRAFPMNTVALVQMAYMSIVCVSLAILVQTWAFQRLSATTVALIFSLEPVVATILAVMVGGASEWPGPRGASGALLVLFAVYAAEGRGLRRRNTTAVMNKKQIGASGADPLLEEPDASQP